MERIIVVVPCYNEQEAVEKFYAESSSVFKEITGCEFEYLFIDDGSTDDTLSRLREMADREPSVNYLSLSRNFGKEAAMMAGLDYAEGDAVIIMDADLQHPPDLIPEMIQWWHAGYDDVCAKRTDRDNESWFKRHMTNVFYICLQSVSRFRVQRDVGDFRLLDKRCVAALRLMRESQRFTKGMFTWVGYRKKEIPFHVRPRAVGTTSWSYLALFNLAVEGLTSFTTAPLRLTTILGICVSMVSMLYMCWVLFNALCYGDPVAGYPTLMTVMLFLGGVQLFSLGIIGEYLGRVFTESKQRPIYLVDEYNGKKMMPNGLASRNYSR